MKQKGKEQENKSLIVDYEILNNRYESEFYDNNSNHECYLVWSWISEIILWIYLVYIFFTKHINYIILIIIYIFHVSINIFANYKWLFLIYNIKTLDELMSDFFYSKIDIKFKSYDNIGFQKNDFNLPYFSYRDVSGLILLKNKTSVFIKSKKYFPVKLVINIYFADDITEKDYIELKNKFCKKYVDNKMRFFEEEVTCNDYYTDIKEEYEFLIKAENDFFASLLINIYSFIFFRMLCLGKIYDLIFFYYVNEVENYKKRENIIILRKLFSTRNNLTNQENNKKYEKYNPCVNFNNKFYFFDSEKSSYTFPNVIPVPPPANEKLKKEKNIFDKYYIKSYESFESVIKRAEEYKEEIKNNNDENFNLKADYLIKVDDSKGNFSFYESS